jgi:hypothetical protein
MSMSSSEQTLRVGPDLAAELDRLGRAVDAVSSGSGRENQLDVLMEGPVQDVLASAVRLYAACLERDRSLPAFPPGTEAPSATDALMAVTAILNAVQIEPFELGLWATWGFRGSEQRGNEAQ